MDLEKEIQIVINRHSNSEGIVGLHLSILQEMQSYFKNNSYSNDLTIHNLLLIPSLFQEANYDDIWWGGQYEALGHLNKILQIDCMFHNSGKLREMLTVKEFAKYVDFSFQAIEIIKKRNGHTTTTEIKNKWVRIKLKSWFS
jgi:hypothetical protein